MGQTFAQFEADMKLLRDNPEALLRELNGRIRNDPNDHGHYFDRHQVWSRLGKLDSALEDLDKAIELEGERSITLMVRGELLYRLGRYKEALADLHRLRSTDPNFWAGCFGALVVAPVCLGELGDLTGALNACANLRGDFWYPGLHGLPRDNKAKIAAEIRRRCKERGLA